MSLTPGSRLGQYEILGPIAPGGMGEVYRAHDGRLDRLVAIKVLKPRFADDPDWQARFAREARLLAAMSHPHIAVIHGLDEADGVHFLVMELVPGRTLADRLKEGRLPLEETLDIAAQMAEALEAAHERGIIHRDFKPGNVMLTPEGRVKVLDFGLARTLSTPGSNDPTAAYDAQTAEGAVLGTAGYMSPEQARGKKLDRRCDVWAFGCVLFEMIVGRKVFAGETYSDIVAVIQNDPDWEALPPQLPPALVRLLRRCLEKDLAKRLRDLGDARLDLDESRKELATPPVAAPAPVLPTPPPARSLVARLAHWLVALAALAAGLLVGRWYSPAPAPGGGPDGWAGQLLLGGASLASSPRLSPDRRWAAFTVVQEGQAQLGVMNLASADWWLVTQDKSRGMVNSYCWSANSERIYFDRYLNGPNGVYWVPRPGAKGHPDDPEPQVLPGAECPQLVAPLGAEEASLLVCRTEPDGTSRLCRCWLGGRPEEPALDAPVVFHLGWPPPAVRALHGREEAVFCARLLDGNAAGKAAPRHLYHLDLKTRRYRRLSEEPVTTDLVPLAVSPDDRYAYTVQAADDLYRIVRYPLSPAAGGGPEPVATVMGPVLGLDVDGEGRLYVDQFQRSLDVLRFATAGGSRPLPAALPREPTPLPDPPERLTVLPRGSVLQPIQFPDQRFLIPTRVLGRSRLLLAAPPREPTPLLDPEVAGETRAPAALVGKDRFAFVVGPADKGVFQLAEITQNGLRIRRSLPAIPVAETTTLAASPAGEELYYVHDRKVYRYPLTPPKGTPEGGQPVRLADGDGLAVHPTEKKLLVQQFGNEGVRLVWVDLDGKVLDEVKVDGEVRPAPYPLGVQAIAPDGKILVPSSQPGNWFWQPALLDPQKGKLEAIPVQYDGDIYPANWDKNGKVLAIGHPFKSELWRLTCK